MNDGGSLPDGATATRRSRQPVPEIVINCIYCLYPLLIRTCTAAHRVAGKFVQGAQMSDKHLSSRFDFDLDLLLTRLLEMGGLVEAQIACAIETLNTFDLRLVEQVLQGEHRLNAMEIEIDEEVSNIIVRRQPTARDLRLLMAASKCITNLERAGDEARKIAKRTRRIAMGSSTPQAVNISEIKAAGKLAVDILRHALDAFARMDTVAAAQIVKDDEAIDNEFVAFMRRLITSMTQDPRTIATGFDYLSIAKAIERIGDHATNIAELVVYIVKGTDVRHAPRELIARC
ncbi:phosphate transport system protein [Paraburkholderia fungorum]|uniref:Phosphate-specific transport system accessory protein PhoU homolog n=2 Tax=Paraburkholderia fungorum TaxID=134537 RepID=A0AAW3UUN7_9BURK|nr:phosphate transport system protein [Paraburkholderia fungorum]MBB6201471.1 phosphate transport system protein [Paraburkholderia fungorum]